MGIVFRRGIGAVGDLSRYALRTGRWWFPAAVLVLGVGALVAATVKVAVPTVVYVLF
ncbi:MAG: hypothetical protein ACOYOQ_04795 [Microthrixaceae bacterium]